MQLILVTQLPRITQNPNNTTTHDKTVSKLEINITSSYLPILKIKSLLVVLVYVLQKNNSQLNLLVIRNIISAIMIIGCTVHTVQCVYNV